MTSFFFFSFFLRLPHRESVCACTTGVSASIPRHLPASSSTTSKWSNGARPGRRSSPRLYWVASLLSSYSTPRLPSVSWTALLFSVLNLPANPRWRRAGAMMAAEPLKSALIGNSGEDTSLALPSDNNLRTGPQRVKDQVHSIKRSKSKQSRNGGISPVSPTGVYKKTFNIT